MDDGERQSLDPGISTLALRSVAVLVLVAAIVGRALAPALLGWKTGIGSLINLTERTAATLSQLMVVAGGFLAVRLLVPTVRERALGLWYRLGVAPVVPAIVTTVFAAATGTLGPVVTLALALGTSVLALTAAAAALGASETRAAGFVLGLAGLGALIQLVARVLAVRASDAALASLFSAARGLATVGFALDVATLLLALLWLSGRNPVRFSILTGAITLLGVFSAWLAYRGATMVDAAGGGGMDVLV